MSRFRFGGVEPWLWFHGRQVLGDFVLPFLAFSFAFSSN